MAIHQKSNQHLMKAIRRMHALVENADIEKVRASQENISGIFSKTREIKYVEVPVGQIVGEWVFIEKEKRKDYVILYCHGGGYNTGSFHYARSITNKLAEISAMGVFSFDYRLAPEYPYPTALEDALNVWEYLRKQGWESRQILIAGDSAGGNLALALTLKLKEKQKEIPKGLLLFSPWTDLTLQGSSHKDKADIDPILNAAYMEKAVEDYAGMTEVKNPLVSPLFGDFTGFPSVCIQVGENEILLSDSEELMHRMKAYQVPVTFEKYEGMWHVFQMSPFKTAIEAMESAGKFIKELCGEYTEERKQE